jgi:hypothetical protein
MFVLSKKNIVNNTSNYLLLISTCLVIFILAEIIFRVMAYHNDLKSLDNIDQITYRPRPGEIVSLGRMIRLSKNSRIIYELIPNMSVIFLDQPVSTNSEGFRGRSIPFEKNDQTVRIVGIGDSVMFGWGVKDKETYLSLLYESLHKAYPAFSWEILNMAVPGYNTAMEVETLKEKGIHYHPDIVIIDYVGNDLTLPNFIRKKENFLSLKQSFTKLYITILLKRQKYVGLTHATFDFEKGGFEGNPERVPEEYRDMVGKNAYYKAMKKLKSLSIENGFEVMVLSHNSLPAFVKEICMQLKFNTIEVLPAWKAYVSNYEIIDEASIWQLSKTDPHPSILGHKIIANTILDYMDREFIQRLMRKKL